MSTSVLGCYVPFAATLIDGLDACDSGTMQRALGNLNHLADQCAQVRVKWVSPNGTGILATMPELDTFQRMWTSTAFDLHVRGDGTSYPLRVRVLAHSGDASDSATWRVVLSPLGESADELHSGDVNVAEVSDASASFTWLQGASLVYLDAPRVRRARARVPAINEASGAAASATWLRVQASVWGAPTDDAASIPALGGLELEECHP